MSPMAEAEARWRVEELARRAGLSVDTVRFYQKRRLLPPPERRGRTAWYGDEHLDRIERIRQLQAEGFNLAVIERLLDGRLGPTGMPLAREVARAASESAHDRNHPEQLLTLEEVSQRSGMPSAIVDAVVRDGLLVPRYVKGEPFFTDADVEMMEAGLAILGTGIPLNELLDLAGRHHRATYEVAEEAVRLFDEHVRQPLSELDPEQKATRLVASFRLMLPAVTALVSHHFRRVLLQVAQEHLGSVGEPVEIAAADDEARQLSERRWLA